MVLLSLVVVALVVSVVVIALEVEGRGKDCPAFVYPSYRRRLTVFEFIEDYGNHNYVIALLHEGNTHNWKIFHFKLVLQRRHTGDL